MGIEIDPYIDCVLIEGVRVDKPDHITAGYWKQFWTYIRDNLADRDNDYLADDNEDLRKHVEDLENEVNGLEYRISELEDEVYDLEDKLGDAERRIEELENDD